MAPHSSTLAWKIPWAEEPGRLQSMRSLRVDMTERFHLHLSLSCIGSDPGTPPKPTLATSTVKIETLSLEMRVLLVPEFYPSPHIPFAFVHNAVEFFALVTPRVSVLMATSPLCVT